MKKKLIFGLVIIVILVISVLLLNLYKYSFNNGLEIINLDFKSRIDKLNNFTYDDYFVVGWLQVQGTNIDLPIFTSTISVMENQNPGSIDINYGWRNINYKNGQNRLAIMGHNILNLSSKPILNGENLTDFEELMSFVYYDFAKENMYAMYTDSEGNEDIYVIYGISFIDGSDDYGYSYARDNIEEINSYIKNVREESIYDYDIDVDSDDDLISLFTCTRFFGASDKTAFRIDLRKLRINEKKYKYKVTENDNYNEVYTKLNKESI